MFRWSLLMVLCLSVAGLGLSEAASPKFAISGPPTAEAGAWSKRTGHEWVQIEGQKSDFYLYRNKQPVGAWDGLYFRSYNLATKAWGPPSLPPWAPEAKVDERVPVPNFGVSLERIKGSPDYSVNGRACTRGEALAAADDIPDESNKFRVVAVGDPSFLDKVAGDWETAKDLHSAAMLQCYGPDFWWVKENNLPDNSVAVCDPTGKAVHFQTGYNLGDWKLFGQAFDPKKVPDLRADPLQELVKKAVDWVKANQLISLAVAALAAYWWYNRKTE